LPDLAFLSLRENGISAEGAAALAGSANLARLALLDVNHNGLGGRGVLLLAQHFGRRVRF
jgi:Leucine Rich repeat